MNAPSGGDRWKRREIEVRLARELHQAEAAYRAAKNRLWDIIDGLSSGGTPAGDSNLELIIARRDCKRAHAVQQEAVARWVAFMKLGASGAAAR
jgi:hypothetical protein